MQHNLLCKQLQMTYRLIIYVENKFKHFKWYFRLLEV